MNKVVWITGASSGIGKALAYEFAQKGARLILSSRNERALEELRNDLKSGDHLVLPIDLENFSSHKNAVEKAIHHFGRIDILINNGGVSQRGLAAETDFKVDQIILNTNYLGTVSLTKCVLPHLLKENSGHIATISSVAGKFGVRYRSSYSASKHALHGFFDSLRSELRATKVGVTLICPGFIKTGVSINTLDGKAQKYGKMDVAVEMGIPPKVCAQKIIRAIEKRKDEVNICGKEIVPLWLKRFFPSLLNKFMTMVEVK